MAATMRNPNERHHSNSPWDGAPPWAIELGIGAHLILERTSRMATEEQMNRLKASVTALIDAGTAEIAAAVAAAQKASPDPAIDELDAKVTAATQLLKEAAAALTPAPPA